MIDRQKYIGGSDAGSILGENDYSSILKVWRKKIGLETDDVDNYHIDRGNEMEPIIERYCTENFDERINSPEMFEKFGTVESFNEWLGWNAVDGDPATRPQITIAHKDFPFCGGHPDGITPTTVWEFKAPAPRNFDRIAKYGVQRSWIIQVQFYMWITGLTRGKIAVWDFNLWRPLIVQLKPDLGLWKKFETVMPAFWFHVETQTEPALEGLDEALDYVDDELFDEILSEYQDVVSTKYGTEDRMKHLKALIVTYMGGAEKLTTKGFHISATKQKRYGTEFRRLIVKSVESSDDQE